MRAWLGVGFVILAVALAPSRVKACSMACLDSAVAPNAESQQVPTNTKIWLLGTLGRSLDRGRYRDECGTQDEPRLETIAGELVPTRRERLANGIALVPEQPLEIGQRYRVPLDCHPLRIETVEFTVTAPADLAPPDPPTIELGSANSGSDECESWNYRSVTASGGDPFYVVSPEGVDASIVLELRALGHEFCAPVAWPRGDAPTKVRFATMDLAGNRSGWTEPETVRLDCSCQSAPTSGPRGLGLFLLLGAGVLRRRRR